MLNIRTRYAFLSMSVDSSASLNGQLAMVDPFGRAVRSLRLSVTQRCDLACEHCHHEGQKHSAKEMTSAEIERIVEVGSSLGIRKVKITGGEPMMREDIVEIVGRVSSHVDEVSLTTNGYDLDRRAEELKRAGLTRVNISLHTLDPDRYARLCGMNHLDRVLRGVDAAVGSGLNPVKVNMVVFKDENDGEIQQMIGFCAKARATLQLIEYETSRENSNGHGFAKRYYSLEDVERGLAGMSVSVTVNELHRRRRYEIPLPEGNVTVEVVRPMHNSEFCSHCTRIRMSSDGLLKPCLLDHSGHVDVLTPLRDGASDRELHQLFQRAVGNRKPYWS